MLGIFYFLMRFSLDVVLLSILVFLFTRARKKGAKTACKNRWVYFLPVILSLLIVAVGVRFVMPKFLDLPSVAFNQIQSEQVNVQSITTFGRIVTDHGTYDLPWFSTKPEVGKVYKFRYFPWSRSLVDWEAVDVNSPLVPRVTRVPSTNHTTAEQEQSEEKAPEQKPANRAGEAESEGAGS